eukprot:gene28001-31097_t
MHGIDLADASMAQVRDLFSGGRNGALYVYDFGYFFEHDIVLESAEEIDSTAGDTAVAALLDGQRACPPEDCGGNWRYAMKLDILDGPRDEEFETTFVECINARNYPTHNFHPAYFDLEATKKKVKAMFKIIKKPARNAKPESSDCSCALCTRRSGRGVDSKRGGSSAMSSAFSSVFPGVPMLCNSGGEIDPTDRQQSNLTGGIREYEGRKDGLACCAFCLDRECRFNERFNICASCKTRFYCSTKCQKLDWKYRHKEACPKLAAKRAGQQQETTA